MGNRWQAQLIEYFAFQFLTALSLIFILPASFFFILCLKSAEPHPTGYTNVAACLVFHQTGSTCILFASVCVHLLLKCHDVCKEANPPCWYNDLARLKIRQQPVIDSRSHIIYTELTALLSSHVFLRCCVTVENHHTPCQKPLEVVSAAVTCTRLSLWLIWFDCTDYAVKQDTLCVTYVLKLELKWWHDWVL